MRRCANKVLFVIIYILLPKLVCMDVHTIVISILKTDGTRATI